MEQLCAVYIQDRMPKCFYFMAYFNRRLGTWLVKLKQGVLLDLDPMPRQMRECEKMQFLND